MWLVDLDVQKENTCLKKPSEKQQSAIYKALVGKVIQQTYKIEKLL